MPLIPCLPGMETRCLTAHVLLCWEYPAHLFSNELHVMDCLFILHLTYNKSVTKVFCCWQDMFTALRPLRNKLPQWRWSLKVVWWFSQSTVLAVPWPCCFSSSASIYLSLNSSHIVDAQCLESHWYLGSLSNNECQCWQKLKYWFPLRSISVS